MTYTIPPKGEDITYEVTARIAHPDEEVTFPEFTVGGDTNIGAFLVIAERDEKGATMDIFAANQRTETIADLALAFEQIAEVLRAEADTIKQQKESTDGR